MGPQLRALLVPTAVFAVALSASLGVALATGSRCHAQSAETLVRMHDDGQRIRAWATDAASRRHDERLLMGGLELAAGGLLAGFGIYGMVVQDAFGPLNSFGVSTLYFATGVVALGLGLFHLIGVTGAEQLAEGLPDGPLDERTIGRLEGRMEQAAELGLALRITNGLLGGGLFLGSGIGLTYLAATGVDPEQFILDYAVPVGLGFSGLLMLITSFLESSPEGDWREYRSGLAPGPRPEVTFHATPDGFALTF